MNYLDGVLQMKTVSDNEIIDTSRGHKRIGAVFDENAMLHASNAELQAALKDAADCLIWAAQESNRKVKKEIVGGWIHHSNKARAAIARARGHE